MMVDDKRKATVLAVDDTPENLDVVKGILGQEYQIKAAVNGKMALKVAETQCPDLILLDVMMPEMDGYEVCRRLKANPTTSQIPVIFLTAKDQTTDETRGFELGAADYILKPVNPAILMARVKTHLALKYNVDALQEAYRIIECQHARMGQELNVGRDIQMSMIPQDFPPFPDRAEFDLHAVIDPAREVGGDFYDFFFINDDELCLCVGDVSGKGVPAALFMAVTRTLIKSRATEDRSIASIVTHVNDELSRDNPNTMFVTVFAAIVNVRTGDLRFTNAGHNPPYIRRGDGTINVLAERHGPMVGVLPGVAYGEAIVQLARGDLLFIFTDGVTEAMNADNSLFSEERLEQLLAERQLETASGAVQEVLTAVQAFEFETERSDDITILAFKYRGSGVAPSKSATIRIRNSLDELPKVAEGLANFVNETEISTDVLRAFNVVFDELLSNVISYGFRDDDEHFIEIKLELTGKRLTVTIIDDGVPFNPLSRAIPDTSLGIEEREVGGLGIHIVRNLVDEIRYQRNINRNVLTLIKKIGG